MDCRCPFRSSAASRPPRRQQVPHERWGRRVPTARCCQVPSPSVIAGPTRGSVPPRQQHGAKRRGAQLAAAAAGGGAVAGRGQRPRRQPPTAAAVADPSIRQALRAFLDEYTQSGLRLDAQAQEELSDWFVAACQQTGLFQTASQSPQELAPLPGLLSKVPARPRILMLWDLDNLNQRSGTGSGQSAPGAGGQGPLPWGPSPAGAVELLDSMCQVLGCYGSLDGVRVYGNAATFGGVPGLRQQVMQLQRWCNAQALGHGHGQQQGLDGAEAALATALQQLAPLHPCPLCEAFTPTWEEMVHHFVVTHQQPALQATAASGPAARCAWLQDRETATTYFAARHRVLTYGQHVDGLLREGAAPAGLQVRICQVADQAADREMWKDATAALKAWSTEPQIPVMRPSLRAKALQADIPGPRAVCIVSDDLGFSRLMDQCQGQGVITISICRRHRTYPGADVTLSWDRVHRGGYVLPRKPQTAS